MGARAEAVRSTQLTEVSSKAKAKVAAAKEVSKELREQREKEIQNLQSYMDEKQAQAASRRQAANEEKIAKASPTKRGGKVSATTDGAEGTTTVNAANPPAPPSTPAKLEVVGVAAPITPQQQ